VEEGVLHQVTQFIEIFVIFTLDLSVFSWRDNRLYSLGKRLRDNGVGIVTPIGQQVVGFYAIDEIASL
jgi:hypothetical protein